MLRMFKLLPLAILALLVAFTVSCEGPAGADGADGMDGADGADGADGHLTCLGCHNDATMLDNKLEMARSQHKLGDIAVNYAGGRASCAQCHGHEGFVEWSETGTVAGNYTTPSPWQCSTCHGLHATFEEDFTGDDAALRAVGAVTLMFDEATEADYGNSNLCINCHQSRRGYASYDDGTGTDVAITSSLAGPHHGPQANLLMGNNGVTAGSEHAHASVGCAGCHMKETTGDDLDIAGGHTFWPTAEACADCHSGADNFDLFSGQTTIQGKLDNLAGLLVTAGVLDSAHHVVVGTYPRAEVQAWWNWDLVYEDRSLGVHNPTYAKALLDASITALGGTP
ncbi:MAG: hypothetical protein K9N38_09340 [Candidatus Marinimicrobia bacterium]|nr:hypothetical protein [Candidatus Neomarinimicrobiota bacterium]